jgi:predicted helicase
MYIFHHEHSGTTIFISKHCNLHTQTMAMFTSKHCNLHTQTMAMFTSKHCNLHTQTLQSLHPNIAIYTPKQWQCLLPNNGNLYFQTMVITTNNEPPCRCERSGCFTFIKNLSKHRHSDNMEKMQELESAIEGFQKEVPKLKKALRKLIAEQEKGNKNFNKARDGFLQILQDTINPDITSGDINEMMIQHILTSDILNTIFDEVQFHRENNIAKELEKVLDTFFTGSVRRATLESIKHYYQTIKANASGIADHHEKQKFLKVVYEAFYKSYNPKAADRLGIVYTPNEIVQFMIHSTNYLLYEYFEKHLEDKGVEILDPCTGTGTFICDIIDSIKKDKLQYKYENEIHANEIAILPYYIANLNIEYTYSYKMGEYNKFQNLSYEDTLNLGIRKQDFATQPPTPNTQYPTPNTCIQVIIGNPPYNANQQNENENNKNRRYTIIDERIKDTFVKQGSSQKTKVYDMYTRFFRWSMDRIGNEGIIAFVTNRSFLDAKGFDGFRKTVQDEFQFALIVDLGGNIRENYGKKGVSIGNVFGIQTGVAIAFLVKIKKQKSKIASEKHSCKIYYYRIEDTWNKETKLFWLATNRLEKLDFETIKPDKNYHWLNITHNDWEKLMPLCDKKNKVGMDNKTVFTMYSNGLVSNRDEWVYDFDKDNLVRKMEFFYEEYNHEVKRWIQYKKKNQYVDKPSDSNPVVDNFLHARNLIKWSKMIKRDKLRKEKIEKFNKTDILECMYRPYTKKFLCDAYLPIDVRGSLIHFFHEPKQKKFYSNKIILFSGSASSKPFQSIATHYLPCLDLLEKTQGCAMFIYDTDGNRQDNITDWALARFRENYELKIQKEELETESKTFKTQNSKLKIQKEDIFHYIYAVLHNPNYRKKYELNLKRDFPRIPFYKDFWKWAGWGKELMDLHVGFEGVEKYETSEKREAVSGNLTPVLKANKEAGTIEIDNATTIENIPKEVWEYKLGSRSAIEWILDQYKETTPSDQTILEKFNTYKFADYKEQVIDLIQRVCTVSVETVRIMKEMGAGD